MADDYVVKYSDIVQPDDSIEKLIGQLKEFSAQYTEMTNAIRVGAEKVSAALKKASGATSSGRKEIDAATEAASRLERAQRELDIALSDTGKQIAWLKAQTSDANRITVEQQRYIKQASTSYDRLKSDLKETVALYKSLSAEERADSEMGQQLLSTILQLRGKIKSLDDQLKPHVQTLTEVEKAEQRLAFLQSDEGQKLLDLKAKISEVSGSRKKQKEVLTEVEKAEQRLAFLQSEEGQRLLDLKAQISDVTNSRRKQKEAADLLREAQEKLAFANSKENEQLKLYSTLTSEANRTAKLKAQISRSVEGSYNRLSAQYELNKIKLNAMSSAEREATEAGKKLEEETASIYKQMVKLQEATGNYRLSVGHYEKAWNGLGFSIAQVVREAPAMATSLNTFFIAISNNIPLVADEINNLRIQNKKLIAEGKPTVSITKQIVKALFSWNSALVSVITILSLFGEEIVDWVAKIIKGKSAVISMKEALKNVADELENTNGNYGSNVVSLKKLQREWKSLKTTAEKKQWIQDNKSEFDKLGISVNSVTDAENAFVKNTGAVIEALRFRTKAVAAQRLAEEKYREAIKKRDEAELEGVGKINDKGELELSKETKRRIREQEKAAKIAAQGIYSPQFGGNAGVASGLYSQAASSVKKAEALAEEGRTAEKTADAYFDLAAGYEATAKAKLKAAGIDEKSRAEKESGGRKGEKPRDLTDLLNKNDITIQKRYEESITKLRSDEYAKRRKEAEDQVQDANNRLREMYRKNEEYVKNVGGKYKELTDSQKEQIAKQQAWIEETIDNNLKALELQLQKIQREQQVNSVKLQREAMNSIKASSAIGFGQNKETVVTTGINVTARPSQIEASLVRERSLLEESLNLEYDLIIDTNRKLLEAGDEQARSEEEIIIELNKKKLELWSSYDKKILEARATDIDNQLELVEKGTDKELELLLKQNETRLQLALAENAAKPAEQQVSTSDITAKYNKSAALIKGQFQMDAFDRQQALDEAIFNEVKRSERQTTLFKLKQEKARWEEQIRLAEQGSLEWSKAQIDAARATVNGIDQQISELNNFMKRVGEKGLGVTLLESLGFDDDQVKSISNATNIIVEQLQNIMAAEIELAEQAVRNAEARVDAAQSAYDAEVEARNNGYANNVATAKKELEQEKKNAAQKQKILEAAQRRQNAINTVTQASSLVTASANIWSSFSSYGIFGPALALAAIAAMWASFTAAKIKAKQVTASSEEYGEGGLEFLEGGSHASGNDIDLGTRNRKGKRMRAEGGEALAIINKKQTRRYRRVLPDVIDSFNRGTFEDKYLNAFNNGQQVSVTLSRSDVDLSAIEKDVRSIKNQNEVKYYTLPNGDIIMQYKNVKRIIRN